MINKITFSKEEFKRFDILRDRSTFTKVNVVFFYFILMINHLNNLNSFILFFFIYFFYLNFTYIFIYFLL